MKNHFDIVQFYRKLQSHLLFLIKNRYSRNDAFDKILTSIKFLALDCFSTLQLIIFRFPSLRYATITFSSHTLVQSFAVIQKKKNLKCYSQLITRSINIWTDPDRSIKKKDYLWPKSRWRYGGEFRSRTDASCASEKGE